MSIVHNHKNEKDNEVVLTLNRNLLAPFIEKVLGGEHEIKKTYIDSFCIDKEWTIQLCDIIDQRIIYQNNGKPVGFRFTIKLSNGMERTLSDISQFKSFYETYNYDVIEIRLNLKYLVSFNVEDVPKIQTISILISKKAYSKKTIGYLHQKINDLSFPEGKIEILVESTQRTFGDDIINMIDTHLSSRLTKTSTYETARFLISLIAIISIIISAILFQGKVGMSIFNDGLKTLEENFNKISDATVISIHEKLSILFEYLIKKENISIIEPVFNLAYTIGITISCLLIFFLSIPHSQSFIIFTEKSKEMHDRYTKKKGKITAAIIFLIAIPISINIFSSYIVNIISPLWEG